MGGEGRCHRPASVYRGRSPSPLVARRPERGSLCLLQQLKQQRDKLRQYQRRLHLQLERERAVARQLLRDGKKE